MDLKIVVGFPLMYLWLAWHHNRGGWKWRKPLWTAMPLWLKWLFLRPDREMLDLITACLQLGLLGMGLFTAGVELGILGRESGRALFWVGFISWGVLAFNLERIQKLMNRRYLKTWKQQQREARQARKGRRT